LEDGYDVGGQQSAIVGNGFFLAIHHFPQASLVDSDDDEPTFTVGTNDRSPALSLASGNLVDKKFFLSDFEEPLVAHKAVLFDGRDRVYTSFLPF
jgi:hypothetical protein